MAKVLLEPGWHWYQFGVSKTAVRAGSNSVQFFYDYAETPKSRGGSSDARQLSVAFDMLQALPKRQPEYGRLSEPGLSAHDMFAQGVGESFLSQ